MKYLLPLLFITALFSCNEKAYVKSKDPIDAAREFIRASLDGDFKKAKMYLAKDENNQNFYKLYVSKYDKLPPIEKDGFKKSSIIINKVENINDSTIIVNYANSFKNKNFELKVYTEKGECWVDFYYGITGNLNIE
ncbi:MAG: hypothetical protein HYR66_16910 [Sphingobacteriales bacterium]|nr:hypothetical protein [Sphingobacteriales bacterium]MBI3719275.1 hypothetical protein [Sphingobacteriales bacterium]